MVKDFLLIGDSNVTRNYTRLGYQVANVTVVSAKNMSEVQQAVKAVNESFKLIVFACLTNLLITSGDGGSNTQERLAAINDTINAFIILLRYSNVRLADPQLVSQIVFIVLIFHCEFDNPTCNL